MFHRINYYKKIPLATQTMKTLDSSPYITGMHNFDIFDRDFVPSKALSQLYNHFYHSKKPEKPNKYKIIHTDADSSESSWLDYLNPFHCDEDYSERDADDEGDDEDDENDL